jgi:hypothetical protein
VCYGSLMHTVTATKNGSTTDHPARNLTQARKLAAGLIAARLADSAVIYRGMQPIERVG